MKLAQALFFFLIIWVTQVLTHAEKSMQIGEHMTLQQELSNLIENYVQQNLPNAQNFKMHSLYTKPPKKGLIEAYFNYSFTREEATTQLIGSAFLKKIKDNPTEWSLEKIDISGEQITFDEPFVITPSQEESSSAE